MPPRLARRALVSTPAGTAELDAWLAEFERFTPYRDEPAASDTAFQSACQDILGRYICNSWAEIEKQRADGGFPFDAVVIGAGMFGGYIAERLYRHGAGQAARILLIDAGA